MLARLPFRSKLILVVSIPLIVLLVVAGFTIRGRFAALGAEEQYADLATPFRALNQFSFTAGNEGVASQWYVHATARDAPAAQQLVYDARRATDTAVAALRAVLPDLDGKVSSGTERQVRTLDRRLRGLAATRRRVDGHADPGSAFDREARDALDAAGALAGDVSDRKLSTELGPVLDLSRQQLAVAEEGEFVIAHLAGDTSSDLNPWDAAITEQATQAQAFTATATGAQRDAYRRSGAGNPIPDPVRGAAGVEVPRVFPVTSVTPEQYATWYAEQKVTLTGGVVAVQRVVDAEASVRESRARWEAMLVALGTSVAILLGLVLARALVRSLNRPLRALTRSAREMSERRLPRLLDTLRKGAELTPDQLEAFTPIRVDAQDEIGELAKAFNSVQQVAVTVAEQQSELLKKGIGDLYVNLARRNQSLLDRQISLLDEMEATVDDADELGALFRLDQLATRMRRNAESLLVLSGAEQPRQWGSAIPVLDVVRAAASEIADFARIRFFGFEGDIAVAGNAVADMTHVLAELLENATAFSPPTAPVVVAGRPVNGGYAITVTDEGIGMDDQRIAAANALLAHPPPPGLALSRTLGLHVVAHLAARYGVRVRLGRSAGSGITALIAIPAPVLARADAAPDATTSATRAGTVRAEPVDVAPGRVDVAPERVDVTPERVDIAPEPVAAAPAAAGPRITWPPGSGEHATASAPAAGTRGIGLAARVPGAHLTHPPGPPPAAGGELRPRPERVHDLLSRHERGKRDGRVRAPDTPAAAHVDGDGAAGTHEPDDGPDTAGRDEG